MRLPVQRVAQFVPFKEELKGRIKILKFKNKPAEAAERFETWGRGRAHLPLSHTYSNFRNILCVVRWHKQNYLHRFSGCVCNQFLTMHQQAVVQAVLLNRSSQVVLESVPQNFCLLREYTFNIFIFTHPDTTDTIGFNAFSIEITSGQDYRYMCQTVTLLVAQYQAIFSGKKISLLQISDCLLWEYFETVALTQQGRGNKTTLVIRSWSPFLPTVSGGGDHRMSVRTRGGESQRKAKT